MYYNSRLDPLPDEPDPYTCPRCEGPTDVDYSSLFFIAFWPNQLRSAIRDEKPGTLAYAQVVAAAVEDYIKTGGWPNRENKNQDTLSLTNDQGTYSVYRY